MLAHSEVQIDFIIEMYAAEHPKELTFRRMGKSDERMAVTLSQRDWANVLIGPALSEFLGQRIPSKSVLNRLRDLMPKIQLGTPPKKKQ